jgi:hypothetical protein
MDDVSAFSGRPQREKFLWAKDSGELRVESQSAHFEYRFPAASGYSFLWPDITDFFSHWGLRLWVGTVDIKSYFEGHLPEFTAITTAKRILGKEPNPLDTVYYPKLLYQQDPTGENSHTPITVYHNSVTDKFYVTKGYKKITTCQLSKVSLHPIILSTSQASCPIDGMTPIHTDQELYNWIEKNTTVALDVPKIGLEFRNYGNGQHPLVPVIHWLDLNETVGKRLGWAEWEKTDTELWDQLPRLVLVTKPPGTDKLNRYNEYFNYRWTNQKTIDVAAARANMDDTMCATVFAPDTMTGRQLTNALVWFSTDADRNIVGAVVADDCAIVYNNNSDLIINMPPGFIKKRDQ